MGITVTLHLIAGLVALVLGSGVLLHEPQRTRNRAFALLCAAFAVWNLGFATFVLSGERAGWRLFYLLGSCATAPLGLNFALVLGEAPQGRRRLHLWVSGLLAGALWIAAWPTLGSYSRAWRLAAIAVIGGILAEALRVIVKQVRSRPRGPEQRALRIVFWGGVMAALGGVSDFLPRDTFPVIHLGPLALLLFSLILCAVVVRSRFLDIDVFFLRAVSLLAAAAAVAAVFFVVIRTVDPGARFVTLFVVSALVLVAAGPLGRVILTSARGLVTPEEPLARLLQETSRRLSAAHTRAEIWETIAQGERLLPGSTRLEIYIADPADGRFRRSSGTGWASSGSFVDPDDPLPRWLAQEGLPVTRRYLERERLETRRGRRQLAQQALQRFIALDARLAVPLRGASGMLGWIALAGELPEHHLTAEVATAFLAVANQATAGIERAAAVQQAQRREALAAVGELAAGLAHEVRNPVAAIRGAAQALGPQATEEQRREMLVVIEEETERLGRFLGEFLNYAKPREPRRKLVDTAALLEDCRKRMELAGMALETRLEVAAEDARITADPEQLREVVENLMRNAYEAAGEQGRLSVRIVRHEDGRLALHFVDDGPGLGEEDPTRIFQPFYTTKAGGTGLGLAVIHRIVEDHGGEVRARNHPGGGAEFVLTFAAVPDRADEAEARST